tara:strand:+ start:200 stop:520 length:321 start_codon:yes stop_codon:yes gene_type:complete
MTLGEAEGVARLRSSLDREILVYVWHDTLTGDFIPARHGVESQKVHAEIEGLYSITDQLTKVCAWQAGDWTFQNERYENEEGVISTLRKAADREEDRWTTAMTETW